MVKTCKDCEKTKPVEDFPSDGNGKFKARCKPCYNTYTAERRANNPNPEALREQWRQAAKKYRTPERNRIKLLAQYGLTVDDYDLLVAQQEGRCKICGKIDKLFVDHCHEGGQVRGLLCNTCNVGLGAFKDNPDFLQSAIEYLYAR